MQFRVAGELNEGIIKVELYRCGWDPVEKDHEKTTLLTKELPGGTPARSFEYTIELDGRLDSQYHALSAVIEVTKKTSISLIAVEFGYELLG